MNRLPKKIAREYTQDELQKAVNIVFSNRGEIVANLFFDSFDNNADISKASIRFRELAGKANLYNDYGITYFDVKYFVEAVAAICANKDRLPKKDWNYLPFYVYLEDENLSEPESTDVENLASKLEVAYILDGYDVLLYVHPHS